MPPEDSLPTLGDQLVVKTEPRKPEPLAFPSSATYPPRPYPSQEPQPPLLTHAVLVLPTPPIQHSPSTRPPTIQPTLFAPEGIKSELIEQQQITDNKPQQNAAQEPTTHLAELPSAVSSVGIKPEPVAHPEPITALEPQFQADVKPEIPMERPHAIYASAQEINYTPENALGACVQIATAVEKYLKDLDLGDLRKDIWFRDIKSFKSQAAPRTMIAVCGATGAGKSSLLNAVLLCKNSCTAVVTKIGYHDDDSILAEVEFLACSEWKAELKILLDDLVEENGKLKQLSDL
ncbi:hypothetical protein BN14_11990 [Rhizoctonia solani AG-1 IB]|uniref:Uncharacterized protein n=1 Tax=Thanatephorus cucumeris (strain AG1-IB / isolate 7/3/14) TaxID=1108050 RepID=M5CEZ9_THACB|nr:hypothetical protein BN14_11990 [Rhizoctonia solani AG-1 IB]